MGELLLLISPDIDTHSRVSGLITSLIIQTVKWLKLDPAEMSNLRRSLSASVIENNALSDNV